MHSTLPANFLLQGREVLNNPAILQESFSPITDNPHGGTPEKLLRDSRVLWNAG